MARQFGQFAVGVVAVFSLLLSALAPTNGAAHAKTATTIFTEAKAAMMSAASFHVLGHFGSGTGETTIDMSMSPSKGGGSFQAFPGGTMEVVVTASTVYIRADEKTWQELTGSKSTAKLVANRWVKEPEANPSYPSIVEFTDSRRFIGLLTTGLAGFSELAAQVSFRGRPAVVLTDSEHDKIYIAASGTPYLLGIQGQGSGSSGSMVFSDFGDAPMPAVPAHAVNLPKDG